MIARMRDALLGGPDGLTDVIIALTALPGTVAVVTLFMVAFA